MQEPSIVEPESGSKTRFYATLESYAEPDTRVYVDDKIQLHWDANDQISLFNKSALNQQYNFKGNTGEKEVAF